MASIGPQIPSHLLQNQRRTEESREDSDEEAGPKPEASVGPSIGPQIPTRPANSAGPSITTQDEDEDDDYGPSLPPDLLAKRSGPSSSAARTTSPARSPSPPGPSRRIVGPTLPGRVQQSYDDDDDYGPMPLPEGAQKMDSVSEGVREFLEKEERRRQQAEVSPFALHFRYSLYLKFIL